MDAVTLLLSLTVSLTLVTTDEGTTDQPIWKHLTTAETTRKHTDADIYDTREDRTANYTGCGPSQLYGPTGTLQSPNYPNLYPDYMDCVWCIYVRRGMAVELTFTTFQLEDLFSDYVTVYDGIDTNDTLSSLTAFPLVPFTINSTSDTMTVVFHSDYARGYRGFRAIFAEIGNWEMTTSYQREATTAEVTTSDYESSSQGGRMSIGKPTGHFCGWKGNNCRYITTGNGEPYVMRLQLQNDSSNLYYNKKQDGGQGTTSPVGPIWLDRLECTDSIYYGPQCSANYWGDNDCSHSEDVSIECYYDTTTPYQWETPTADVTTPYYESTSQGGRMSIALGTLFRLEGQQLEVYHNRIWGTVCDDGFTDRTTRSICKLIYGKWPSYARYYNKQHSGRQSTSSPVYPIWLDQLECTDSYYYGPQCSANYWGVNDCSHNEDVSIECYFSNETTTEYATEYPTTMVNTAPPHYSSDMYVSAITVDCYPNAWNIMIYLPELYKRHSDFDPADIYLGRPGCQGYRSGNYLRIDQQYSNCQTHHFTTPSKVEYTNTLVYAYRDADYKFIIREYRFKIDVECDMATHETVSQHFIETHNQVRTRSNNPHISSTGHYNIRMSFYSDPGYQQQMYGSPLTVRIGEDIYVSVTTPLSDYDVKMRVQSCYTLPSQNSGDQFKFYLINNGCTSDVNTHVIYISSHETRFVFRDFEYSSDQDNLYLFCTATFCNVTDYSSACNQSCHKVQRRYVQSASETYHRKAETSEILHQSKGRSRREVGEIYEVETSGHAQYISVDDHLFIAVIVNAVGISIIAIFVAIHPYRKPKSRPIDTI